MLELRHVTKVYSAIPAVSDVSFIAPAGEVTGYLGPNGSGKSTTLKMIAGLIEPSEGQILFRGEPIGRNRIKYRQSFGYVPEERNCIHISRARSTSAWWASCAEFPSSS